MNNSENNYCEECDNDLGITFKKYKNSKKKINDNIEKINFIPINFESLPNYYCNLCNKNNHKINKCPLLNDNISFNDSLCKKEKSNFSLSLSKKIIKKSILKSYKLNNDFDICYQLSNLNIKITNKKKVKFNLPTTH